MPSLAKKTAAKLAFRAERGLPAQITDLQLNVKKMMDEGTTDAGAIATKLNVPIESVYVARSRMRKFMDLEKIKNGRKMSERPRIEELIDKGLSNKIIAERLGKSPNNVAVQRKNIMDRRKEKA